ncbi:MAG: PBECR2 nuclease fold domain-containing protein [Neptuniibacter sp.]
MVRYGGRTFKEKLNFLQKKVPLPTTSFEDVQAAQHDHAFMVAGANNRAIVEDFFKAILAAEEQGETLRDFQKRFDDIVEKHGWDYNGSRGWRSKLIYETNMRQAYNAGREAQFTDPTFKQRHPYMMYRHSGAENYRPEHKSWDGLVLPVNDPWWHKHSPQNGYGCKCKKFAVSERYLKRLGKTVPDTAPQNEYYEHLDKRTGELLQVPKGIDPGFDYTPGASQIRHTTPSFLEEWPANVQPIPIGPVAKPALPVTTLVPESDILPDGLSDEKYVQAFLDEFGGTSLVFKDALGEPLAINDQLFRNAKGELKVSKDKVRHRYMKLLGRALTHPDEIWAILEPDLARPGKYRLKRRYIARWETEESGQAIHGFSAFEFGQGLWTGNTIFTPYRKQQGERVPNRDAYLEKQREGVLLYRKEE